MDNICIMLSALPTIFHVKEGVFRLYKGPRNKEDFLSYVEEKKWEQVEPISSWQSPSSIQMSLISQFYKISMSIRVNYIQIASSLQFLSTYD